MRLIGSAGGLVRQYRGFQPDARRYLLVTLVGGAALSLWWIDFNLYLASLGMPASQIGLVSTGASLAGAAAAFPASAWSDRIGRRLVMIAGTVLSTGAVVGLVFTADPTFIVLLAALFAAGDQASHVVAVPFLSEHSEREHRSELFALQFALTSATNVIAAALGGVVARTIADSVGLAPDGPDTYRIILGFMAVLLVASIAVMTRIGDDRPSVIRARAARSSGEPAAFPVPRRGIALSRLGLTVVNRRAFARILLPGILIPLGAGQVIPFLNLFVQRKFGLDLAALNGAFALTSIGTMLAILFQPVLARRLGRVRSVVLVQGVSIPFLVVLGFSPLLWTVIAAMAVRNSLMNAGNPIASAIAMDQVSGPERATLAAAMSLAWSGAWVVAGAYYAAVQATLGFDAGYAVNFATIIVLYSVATALYWYWFRDADGPSGGAVPAGPATAMAGASD